MFGVGFYSGGGVVARRSCKDSDVQGEYWAVSTNSPVKDPSLRGQRRGPRLGRRSGRAQQRVDKSPGVAEARGFRQGAPWPRLGRAVTFPGTEAREPPSPAGRAGARRHCGPLRLPGQPRRFLLVGRDRLSAPFSNCAGAGAIGRSGRSQ